MEEEEPEFNIKRHRRHGRKRSRDFVGKILIGLIMISIMLFLVKTLFDMTQQPNPPKAEEVEEVIHEVEEFEIDTLNGALE